MDMNCSDVYKEETFTLKHTEEILRKCNLTDGCLQDYSLESDITFFRFILLGIILGPIEILGVIGNILSMIVLSRPQMRSSINCLLLGLTIFDTVVILNSIIILTLASVLPYTDYFFQYNLQFLPYYVVLFQPFMAATYMASVYLTLAVTIERYVAVCHPLKAKIFCSTGTSKKCVYGIGIFAFLYNLPMYWERKIETVQYALCNLTINCITEAEMGKNKLFIVIYWEYMHSVFISLIPLISLMFFNICIYREVKRTNKNREEMSLLLKTEIDLARMLLRIVFVFLMCNIMFPILHISRYIVRDNSLQIWPMMKDMGQFLICINCCVNFIMYIVSGTKFKQVFVQLVWSELKQDGNSSEMCVKQQQKT